MPNRSKINDPRFWEIWRRSGAVAKVSKQVTLQSAAISEYQLMMAKKAFALAIHEHLEFIRPKAEDVVVEPGVLYHDCKWSNGDGLGERFEIHGAFYRRELEPDNQGSVCITFVSEDNSINEFPFSWHFLFCICEEYEQMENMPIKSIGDEVCPSCCVQGRVGENHIGGGAEFGGDSRYCYNCCSTF